MKPIITLTLNPTVDKSTSVDKLVSEQKLSCAPPVFEPGGGGINVSRALRRLGTDSVAVFPVGGPTGAILRELLTHEGITQQAIETTHRTRENFIVVESTTNHQFRFGMPGTPLEPQYQQQILQTLRDLAPTASMLVVSGSLPPGVDPAYLGEVAHMAEQVGIRLIVDTSGPALERALDEKVYLIKPNVGELSRLSGVDALDSESVPDAAQSIIARGKCDIIVVSLGPQGACLITKDTVDHVPAPAVKKRSTVGAGDSMVAGMVWALSNGQSLREVIRMGVACGTAATMNPGTELFHPADANKLYRWLLQMMPALA